MSLKFFLSNINVLALILAHNSLKDSFSSLLCFERRKFAENIEGHAMNISDSFIVFFWVASIF